MSSTSGDGTPNNPSYMCEFGCFDSTSSYWGSWGRWVLLAAVIFVIVVAFILVNFVSRQRVQHGRPALPGTSWLVPPSYYQSQQQAEYPTVAAPAYNPEVGEDDMGYYDENGNLKLVSKRRPLDDEEQVENTVPHAPGADGEVIDPENAPPPNHPPPAAAADTENTYGPPAGPPPDHVAEAADEQSYGPPAGAPPQVVEEQITRPEKAAAKRG